MTDAQPFRFLVLKVERIASRDVAVVEGTLCSGRVLTGDTLVLQRGPRRFELQLQGVLLGARTAQPRAVDRLSLVFNLRNLVFDVLAPGDELTGAGPAC